MGTHSFYSLRTAVSPVKLGCATALSHSKMSPNRTLSGQRIGLSGASQPGDCPGSRTNTVLTLPGPASDLGTRPRKGPLHSIYDSFGVFSVPYTITIPCPSFLTQI